MAKKPDTNEYYWACTVREWGTFYVVGTEEQARREMLAKAEWEGTSGFVKHATVKEIAEKEFDRCDEPSNG